MAYKMVNVPWYETKFPIGTKFRPIGQKHNSIWTVRDILRTYNSAGQWAASRYVASHEFMGQTITDNNVLETTIARGLISNPEE